MTSKKKRRIVGTLAVLCVAAVGSAVYFAPPLVREFLALRALQGDDPFEQEEAAEYLVSVRSLRAIEPLREMLVAALRDGRPPGATSPQYLRSDSYLLEYPSYDDWVPESLARLGPRGQEVLLDLTRNDADCFFALDIISDLDQSPVWAVPRALELCEHEDPFVRQEALDVLVRSGVRSDAVLRAFATALGDWEGGSPPFHAQSLVSELLERHFSRLLPHVLAQLEKSSEEQQAFILNVFNVIDYSEEESRELVSPLLRRMRSDHENLRENAHALLITLELPVLHDAVPQLVDLLQSPTPWTRHAAQSVLSSLGPAGGRRLVEQLRRVDAPQKQATILRALSDMVEIEEDVARAIRPWQEDRVASVRYAAAAAYLQHAAPDAATVRGVIDALREGDVTERRKAVWDAQVLAPEHPAAREALEQALEQDDMTVRLNAVLALYQIEKRFTPAMEPVLRAGLASDDPSLRSFVIQTLADQPVGLQPKVHASVSFEQARDYLRLPYRDVHIFAMNCLARVPETRGAGQLVDEILPFLQIPDHELLRAALHVLEAIGPAAWRAMPRVKEIAEHQWALRDIAQKTLKALRAAGPATPTTANDAGPK